VPFCGMTTDTAVSAKAASEPEHGASRAPPDGGLLTPIGMSCPVAQSWGVATPVAGPRHTRCQWV
jgi:hypothetical protein